MLLVQGKELWPNPEGEWARLKNLTVAFQCLKGSCRKNGEIIYNKLHSQPSSCKAGEAQGVTAFQTNKTSHRHSISCFLCQLAEAFRQTPSDPLLQRGFESWMSNPPPSCQREAFLKSVSWLLCVFILLTGWYLDPHIFSPLAGLSSKGVISPSKEWRAVQPAWREVMENRVLANKSSRTRVTYW